MNAWWILALAFALTAGLLLAAAAILVARIRESGPRIIHERFTCPRLHKDVTASFLIDQTGKITEVRSCSAFLFPEEVTCDAECIAHLNESLTLDRHSGESTIASSA